MAGLRDSATSIAQFLGKELQLDNQDIEALRYGLEFYIGTVINFVVIVVVAWSLVILPYVLATVVTTSSLRPISGGAHSATFFGCLTLGTVIIVGIGKLASIVGMVSQALLFWLIFFSVVSGFYIVYKWVPADTPANPIISMAKRARFRKLSYIYIIAWASAMILLVVERTSLTNALAVASLGGFLWQFFSITPAGYWFVATMDTLFEKCHITL